MPKETFKNLSKEKQEKLLNSAINEFSRVPYEEASINKIIESAGIPRGSFYMYFNDKEDIYNYILCTDRKKLEDRLCQLLDTYKGDFVIAWENIYDEILDYCNTQKHYNFFKNFFLDMRFSTERKQIKPSEKEKSAYKQLIISKIDKKLYNIYASDPIYRKIFNLSIIYKRFE